TGPRDDGTTGQLRPETVWDRAVEVAGGEGEVDAPELGHFAPQLRVVADHELCVGLAAEDADDHRRVAAVDCHERVAVGDHDVQLAGGGADLRGHPVDDGQARADRLEDLGRVDRSVAQETRVVQK